MARETTALPDPIVICGAGLSGLSLACALLEAGERRELVLVDPRTSWERDRTWCWWAARPSRFDGAISARWRSWEVVGADGRRAAHTDARLPYVHAAADDVYGLALERLGRAGGQVDLRTRTAVAALDLPGRAAVLAGGERLAASWLIDARATTETKGSDPFVSLGGGLVQAFTGLEVRTDRPVFTPGRATLMDFAGAGLAPPDGTRFVYVLPFAPDHALVEDTTFAPGDGPSAEQRRRALGGWLAARGTAWEVLREEQGRLPMTSARRPTVLAERVVAVGTGAGAVRPSSGYAFSRIQAHATALAAAIAADAPPPARLASRRTEQLDAVFLRAVTAAPERTAARFGALVQGTTADAFARFMADAATPADEAQVVLAAVDRTVLRAAAAHVLRRGRDKGV